MRSFSLFASLLLLGCSSNGDAPPPDRGDAGPIAPVDGGAIADGGADAPNTPDAHDGGVPIPASPAGAALAWVLAGINGAPVTSADVTAHFTPAFVQAVGAAQIPALFQQLALEKAWTLVGFDGQVAPEALTAILTRGDGQYWRIALHVDPAQGNAIDSAFFDPAGDLDPALATYDAVDQAMKAIAPNVNLLAATLDGDACTSVHALNPTASLALGSAFKLWILAAAAQSIDAGTRAWTDTIAIEDKYKSLPSGTMQTEADGTKFTVLQIAQAMISKSDNTATDHLLFTVGRPAVEAMLTTTKHHAPAENQPFFSTRELFSLKLMLSPADQQAFLGSTTAQKRTLLDQYDATIDPRKYAGPAWIEPRLIDKLEWFATPGDLCNVMLALKAYADKPATKNVYDVLAINPGISDRAGLFSYVGYKGGSEPGVLDLTWLMKRKKDQKWVFFTTAWNDTQKPVDDAKAVYVAGAARAILGR
jgi:hypothetical protein